MREFRIRLVEPVDGRVFVTGFHGIGLVGYIAVRHLAQQCRRVGFLSAPWDPPSVTITDTLELMVNGELYACDRGIMALVINYGIPNAATAMRRFAQGLARWVVEAGFSEAVLFGGLDSSFRQGQDRLRVVKVGGFRGKDVGAPHMEPKLSVVGPLAIMLETFDSLGFPALAVLPYADPNRPDPAAASVALEFLSSLYGIKVDVEELKQLAREYERMIEAAMRRTTREESPHYI